MKVRITYSAWVEVPDDYSIERFGEAHDLAIDLGAKLLGSEMELIAVEGTDTQGELFDLD